MEMSNTIFLLVFFGLILLFFFSFTLFIRKLLTNSSHRNTHSNIIVAKLDQIIEQNNEIIKLSKKSS